MNRAGSCNLQSCQSLCSAPGELPLGVLRPSHAEAAQEGPISSHGALWTNLCHRRNAVWGKAQSSSQGWMLARLVALPWDVLLPESSYPMIKRGITYLTLGPGGGERQKSHLHTPCTATHIIQVAAPLCTSAQHKLCFLPGSFLPQNNSAMQWGGSYYCFITSFGEKSTETSTQTRSLYVSLVSFPWKMLLSLD